MRLVENNKVDNNILKTLVEEQEGRNFSVCIGFAGYIGVEEEYNVYAMDKLDAVGEALDNPGSEAEMDLSVDEINDNGDGSYDCTVSFAGNIGADQEYTVYADSEEDAEQQAIEEAKSDLEVISVDGEEFSYDDAFSERETNMNESILDTEDITEEELINAAKENPVTSDYKEYIFDGEHNVLECKGELSNVYFKLVVEPTDDVHNIEAYKISRDGRKQGDSFVLIQRSKLNEAEEPKEENNVTDDEYKAIRERLKKLCDLIKNILSTYTDNISYVDNTIWSDDLYAIEFSCKISPDSISKYENDISLYGRLFLDKNFHFTQSDVMTSSGPNVLNQQFISAANALYTFVKSDGDSWTA